MPLRSVDCPAEGSVQKGLIHNIMNPLNHAENNQIYVGEIQQAIDAVRTLKDELAYDEFALTKS